MSGTTITQLGYRQNARRPFPVRDSCETGDMRRSDLDSLAKPYAAGGSAEEQFAEALGVYVQHAAALETAVLRDLDPTVFGVGWWAGYAALGDKRRILIGDYLVTSIPSIQTNLVEARLHLLALLETWEQQSTQMADSIVPDPTHRFRIRHPERLSAADGLPDAMSSLHVAGFFRAINSALDCLGAAIVGVAALDLNIVKTDYDKARTNLASKAKVAGDLRQTLDAKVDALVAQAGPPGWLAWTTKFRHMLLHRARRLQVGTMQQRRPPLLGPDGRVVVRADLVPHLTTEPGRSDVDALRDISIQHYLGEHASETVHGVLKSTVFLIDGAADALCQLWEDRKKNPHLLEQPAKQWPDTAIPAAVGFAGYAPKSQSANVASANDALLKRLTCAALGDSVRHRWNNFT
jgi:hypothetical protein